MKLDEIAYKQSFIKRGSNHFTFSFLRENNRSKYNVFKKLRILDKVVFYENNPFTTRSYKLLPLNTHSYYHRNLGLKRRSAIKNGFRSNIKNSRGYMHYE